MTTGEEPQPATSALKNFESRGVTTPEGQTAETGRRLAELRLRDAEWRIRTRPRVGWTIIVLLIAQNALVGLTILIAALNGGLQSTAPVLIGISAATLGETAAIVQIVVKWLFSEIDYGPISEKRSN